jgi:hypothetical protein
VAINREEESSVSEVLDTGMAPGRYCDVISDCAREVEVADDGTARIEIGSLDALAIHTGSRVD